jgi:hypothetical protein
MWLSTFTTRHGNICIRFGSRVVNVQACAAAKPLVGILKRYPATASVAGIVLPLLLQIYLASRKTKK